MAFYDLASFQKLQQDDYCDDYFRDNDHYLAALCFDDYVRRSRSDPADVEHHRQSVDCYTTSSCLGQTKSSFYRTLAWPRTSSGPRQASVGRPTTKLIRDDDLRRRDFLFDHGLVSCIHPRALILCNRHHADHVKKSLDSRRLDVLF
jgi:hypothetical protein